MMEDKERNDDEINLLDYINVIKKHKRLILSIVAVSVVITTIIYSLLAIKATKVYEARAVIMPATQSREQGGMSAIAMQLGISTPSTPNVSEIMSLLNSNILMEKVNKRYNLIPLFFEKGLKGNPHADKTWDGIRYLKNIFKVKHKQMEGIIELSTEYKDPKIAADIINYILIELTEHMTGEAKRVAETNKRYLESLIDKNSDPLIRQKIYSLIAQQIEISMMAEVKENFAFKIIDPPKVPDRKINKPKIRMNIMLSFVIALFLGIFIAFFLEYIEKVKRKGGMDV